MIWLFLKLWPVAVYGSILINEISFRGSPEWIELYNNGNEQADLSGLILKDANNSTKDDLELSGTIAPNGFVVFENSKSWLNDTGDTVYLISSGSGSVLDQTSYEKPPSEKTFGRTGGGFEYMSATRGSTNVSSPPDPTATPPPTSTPTPSPTKTPTPTPTKSVITQAKIEVTNTPTQSAQTLMSLTEETTREASESAQTVIPEILGESTTAGNAETTMESDETGGKPKVWGYLLMMTGSVISLSGGGFLYLKHKHDGVKING